MLAIDNAEHAIATTISTTTIMLYVCQCFLRRNYRVVINTYMIASTFGIVAASWAAFALVAWFLHSVVDIGVAESATIAYLFSWIFLIGAVWYVRERRRKLNSPGPSSS